MSAYARSCQDNHFRLAQSPSPPPRPQMHSHLPHACAELCAGERGPHEGEHRAQVALLHAAISVTEVVEDVAKARLYFTVCVLRAYVSVRACVSVCVCVCARKQV